MFDIVVDEYVHLILLFVNQFYYFLILLFIWFNEHSCVFLLDLLVHFMLLSHDETFQILQVSIDFTKLSFEGFELIIDFDTVD